MVCLFMIGWFIIFLLIRGHSVEAYVHGSALSLSLIQGTLDCFHFVWMWASFKLPHMVCGLLPRHCSPPSPCVHFSYQFAFLKRATFLSFNACEHFLGVKAGVDRELASLSLFYFPLLSLCRPLIFLEQSWQT